MPHFSQDRSPLKVFTPLGENTLLATRLKGREKLGDGFEFTVSLIAAPGTRVDFSKLLGQNASVRVELPGGVVRHFHGEIWEFFQHDSDTAFDHYTMVLRPWLDRLRLIKRSRIFQNLSALDIWKQMLEPLAMPRVFAVHKPLPKRVCCTQFRETDWAFFMRLCSDTGNIHYWKHAENSHTLTITDDTTNTATSLGDIDYNTSVGGTGRATTIHSWCLGQKQAPQLLPAQTWATRTQHDDCVSARSQKKRTCTRPNWSVKISCPGGPMTIAVCMPPTFGRPKSGQWYWGSTRGAHSTRASARSVPPSDQNSPSTLMS